MEGKIKKIISEIIIPIAILGIFIMFQSPSANAAIILDGDSIRNPKAVGEARFDVYIAKIVGEKKFKRLVLSPHVFNSYGHLHWEDVIDVDQSVVDSFTTSNLVRATVAGDPKVFMLYPAGDTGEKRWIPSVEIFNAWGFDWDSVYTINEIDRDTYVIGEDIKEEMDESDTVLPVATLEEKIPEIKDYPKLEQVFIDLYAYQGFQKEEIDFMKAGLKTYKEKPKLKEYPKEALLYLMSRVGGPDYYDADFFSQTLIPLAKEITVGTKDDLAAVKAIYKWVNGIMTYDRWFYYDYITPQNILREKRGACGEYAVLIAALSKATGIPARYVSSVNTVPLGLPHAWVEVYISGDWIAIPSTGYLDYDHDGIIEHSDLKVNKNDKMVDIFIQPLYSIARGRTDITLGYNKDIVQRMIAEVEDMLKEDYNLEAKENLELAKDIFSPWEEEKSTKDRNRIGRETAEHLLRSKAILEENIASEEIQVAFLEDFPIFKYVYIDGKPPPKPKVWTSGVIQSADIGNLDVFWEDFQKTLVEANPKVLYLFDSADEEFTSIGFAVGCKGIDFLMIRAIDELIKSEGLSTKLKFALYWSDKNDVRKMEFLEYEDIEPVITLNNLFHDNALDFMWDFIGAVNSVKDSATKTNFYLPPKFEERYNYYISAVGPSLHEDKEFYGYSLRFRMVVEISFGGLPLTLELHNTIVDIFPEYTNLIIVDELGNVSRPEEKDGKYYYSVCPSYLVNLDPGQNLVIEREGDFIKITEMGGE